MNNILSNLLFSSHKTETTETVPPFTIIIDTSGESNYINFDYINKSVYNKFVHDYSKFSKNDNLTLNITSFGGDIFYILLIANIINKHKGKITANITKYCMSGVLLIALSCDAVYMADSACISPMRFYNTYIPFDFLYTTINNLPADYIPFNLFAHISTVKSNLEDERERIVSNMRKLLQRQFDNETIDKIISELYLHPVEVATIFKENIPKYLNIIYESINEDSLDSVTEDGEDVD